MKKKRSLSNNIQRKAILSIWNKTLKKKPLGTKGKQTKIKILYNKIYKIQLKQF